MKRMTENAISYYTIKPDDIVDITVEEPGIFSYTPSAEFIEVVRDFKSVLRTDWTQIGGDMSSSIGSKFSILYPINKITVQYGTAVLGYNYSAGTIGNKKINPVFFDKDGKYFIAFQ